MAGPSDLALSSTEDTDSNLKSLVESLMDTTVIEPHNTVQSGYPSTSTRKHPNRQFGAMFRCLLCGYYDRKKFNVKQHVENVHFQLRKHACHWCGIKRYSRMDQLRKHMRKEHELEYRLVCFHFIYHVKLLYALVKG
ncbi:hypothetical protein L226DRAFT_50472 [Lentinus tigrinus ALCF2SS1-7]|uniref:uncharacterized protein n=1 Tax=Lentinus tigrinus ALCF2SS1-7 TaxID=1328758 RepID=UPI0011663450|nr:hypothetical protein L226DRAFT_50472 [Lentinus tigrinus ALCF2SS1-7]